MNNRLSIKDVFRRCRDKREKVLIVYLTAGYPDMDRCFGIIQELEYAGADIIELGIPFSDPVADGPTIQYSSQVAIKQGASLSNILSRLETLQVKLPVIIMTYLNPLLCMDRPGLFQKLVQSRVSGLIIPDLPFDMASAWRAAARENSIDLIMLAAPTSPDKRLKKIINASQGFIYCVSVTGTTGARHDLPENLPAFLQQVRSTSDKPVVVGFGISKPDHIIALKQYADGFIIGSRIINAIRNNENICDIVTQLKTATRR